MQIIKKIFSWIKRYGFGISNHGRLIPENSSSTRLDQLIKSCQALIKQFDPEKFQFKIQNDSLFFISNNTRIKINNYEELFIIEEVFNNQTYNFITNENIIILDVGSNIGASVLFFSEFENVKKIYSFEPVPETFLCLNENIKMSQIRENTLELRNYGLSSSNKIESFQFSPDFKGSVGIIPLSESKKKNSSRLSYVDVELKDVFEVFNDIFINSDLNSHSVLLKMDCEGGENDIIKRLVETKIINKINYLILEWHGNEFLNSPLLKLDEFVFFMNKNSNHTGMLYAFRK